MGKIIAITNQKGGVGKTTTAVNLSACLANLGKKVLMVDLDPQGNGTSGLGIVKKPKMQSVYSVLVEDSDIKKCIAKTQMDNLNVLPSTIDDITAFFSKLEIDGSFKVDCNENYRCKIFK